MVEADMHEDDLALRVDNNTTNKLDEEMNDANDNEESKSSAQ